MLAPPNLAQWLDVVAAIKQEIFHIFHARAIWREVRNMLRTNPQVDEPPYLFQLMTEWYATSQSVGVRRQNDTDETNKTMGRLITELGLHASTVSRAWYRSLYGQEEHWLEMADEAFDRFAPNALSLSPDWCRGVAARLETAADPIRKYVNRRVAHTDSRPVQIPTFSDLDEAIDLLGELLKEIVLLLEGGSIVELEPVMQFDWKNGLRVPWQTGAGTGY